MKGVHGLWDQKDWRSHWNRGHHSSVRTQELSQKDRRCWWQERERKRQGGGERERGLQRYCS